MRWFIKGILVAGYVTISLPALSGTWVVLPAVSLTGVYTDNISLMSTAKADDEFITTITPSISVSGEGVRATVELDYSMEALYYGDSQNNKNDTVFHQLNSNIRTELAENLFFFDASAGRKQQMIDTAGVDVLDNFSLTTNRTDVTTVVLSPYLRSAFAKGGSAELRYTQNSTNYDALQVPGSRVEKISALIGANQPADIFGWTFNYEQQKHFFDLAPSSELERADIALWYSLKPRLRFLLDMGWERHIFDFISTSELAVDEKSFWLAGWLWRPSIHTLVEGKFGERFFGRTASLRLDSRMRRTNFGINYTEDVTSAAVLGGGQGIGERNSLMGSSVSNLNSEVFVRRRLVFNLDWIIGRNTFGFNASLSRRNFQLTKREEQGSGAIFNWSRSLSSHSLAAVEVGSRTREGQVTGQKDKLLTAEASLSSRLGRRLSSVYSYRHTKSESTVVTNVYNVNVISASLRLVFP